MRATPRSAESTIYSPFIQNLTESVRRSSNVALVVTLPSSAPEAGAQTGQESLQRVERILNSLDSIMGRVETVWQPLEIDEAFEVVRRRLSGTSSTNKPVKPHAERFIGFTSSRQVSILPMRERPAISTDCVSAFPYIPRYLTDCIKTGRCTTTFSALAACCG